MADTKAVSIKRAYADGCVKVAFVVDVYSHGSSVRQKASIEITADEARVVAASLLAEADRVDGVATKKREQAIRRKKWRDREVAAGRMKIITVDEFMGRRTA